MNDYYAGLLNFTANIEKSWLRYNYATEDFHKVVADHAEDFDLSPLGDLTFQMQLLDHPSVRVNQHRSTFSDYHNQIFHNGRFLIEILNWSGSHVNVHDHDFSALQFQLRGNSLNVVYDFDQTSSAGALNFGRLSVRHAEMWKAGDRSVVRHGNQDTHSVFHLSVPTTSLLIRTAPTPRFGAQSNYFPTLSANYYVNSEIQRKKLTGLALLARQAPADFTSMLEKFLNEQSLSENFFMLLKLAELPFLERYVQTVITYAERGESEAKLVESVIANNGIDFFKSRASAMTDLPEAEKLAASIVAAGSSDVGVRKIITDLSELGIAMNFKEDLQSFVRRLNESDRDMANRYLSIFNVAV